MTKTKTKARKIYAKKPTKKMRIKKKKKQLAILTIILIATATLSVIQAYHLISLSNELSNLNRKGNIEKLNKNQIPEISMIDYVLNEVEQAGYDKYRVYNLIHCESHWDDQAVGVNARPSLGVDLGLWQINTKFHKEVSPACSFDYKCQTKEAIRILNERGFKEWSCGQ